MKTAMTSLVRPVTKLCLLLEPEIGMEFVSHFGWKCKRDPLYVEVP